MKKMQISWPGQSGPHPMAQPTFLVKTHLVLIVWRMSYGPPCVAPSTKWGWITRKKSDLICGAVNKDEPGENFKRNDKI